jgi:zinc transporter ZupT
MNPLAGAVLFALVAAFASILGGIIVISSKWARRSLRYFIALGSGFMLGTVFLEMMPESLALTPAAPALVLVGYGIVHIFEHTFASHLHFGEETHQEEVVNPVVGISALVGMMVHTFFDGVAIGAGFIVSPSVGLLTARSKARPGSGSGPSTWSSGCGPARSPSSTTSTSTGSPPRS